MKEFVSHVEFSVTDMKRSVKFFETLFDWKFSGDTYAMCNPKSGPSIGLFLTSRVTPGDGVTVYFQVDDVDSYIARAKTLGVSVIKEKTAMGEGEYFAEIADPDGNPIGLYQGK
jgi:hypothetical protein